MIALIQEIASKSYTFREVVALVTIAMCTSFSIGFLLAAYTRIFKEGSDRKDDYLDWSKIPKEVLFIAAEESGYVYGWQIEPEPGDAYGTQGGGWNCNARMFPLDQSCIVGPLPPWRESLRRRPS